MMAYYLCVGLGDVAEVSGWEIWVCCSCEILLGLGDWQVGG